MIPIPLIYSLVGQLKCSVREVKNSMQTQILFFLLQLSLYHFIFIMFK